MQSVNHLKPIAKSFERAQKFLNSCESLLRFLIVNIRMSLFSPKMVMHLKKCGKCLNNLEKNKNARKRIASIDPNLH